MVDKFRKKVRLHCVKCGKLRIVTFLDREDYNEFQHHRLYVCSGCTPKKGNQ